MTSVSSCSTCGEEVRSDEKALFCDLCEIWEHQLCVRETEQLNEELYQSMTTCSSKSIIYVCTPCRNKGSVSKRLMQLEFECARISEQRLASERLLEERQSYIAGLLADK